VNVINKYFLQQQGKRIIFAERYAALHNVVQRCLTTGSLTIYCGSQMPKGKIFLLSLVTGLPSVIS